ncbi:aldehyde dehydrogenase, partial [Mesorhizobium sp. M5C.F.Ca.IN.020.14.1.1]
MTQRAARRFANWIGGAWRGANGPELERRDPASGAVVSLFRDSTADDVDAAVSSAMAA